MVGSRSCETTSASPSRLFPLPPGTWCAWGEGEKVKGRGVGEFYSNSSTATASWAAMVAPMTGLGWRSGIFNRKFERRSCLGR